MSAIQPFANSYLFLLLIVISAAGYFLSTRRAVRSVAGNTSQLHSLPKYFGSYTAILIFCPAALLFFVWSASQNSIILNLLVEQLPPSVFEQANFNLNLFLNKVKNLTFNAVPTSDEAVIAAAQTYVNYHNTSGWLMFAAVLGLALLCFVIAYNQLAPQFRARNRVEFLIKCFLIICSIIAIMTTLGIVTSVLFESFNFFTLVPVTDFLFGTQWAPGPTEHAKYGAIPLFAGTMLITLIAMLVAVPIGLLAAIYLAEYASSRVRSITKPLLEILAGIPTVVYGFFAAITVAPFIREMGESVGLDVASESALAAGAVMGIMIIPFISSLSDDVINAVPQSLRDGSYGLGATKSETIKKVILPAALPGIVGAVLLALSRAIGETMIVVMAAGLAANLTANPLDNVTTVTVQIVTALVGDQAFESAQTLVAFALGLVLFIVTLILNVIALIVVRKYREQYD
jgi:phosphate transport system permease protein